MKSICIKTNNSDLIQYLLNELNDLELELVYFSCRKFKHYNNIIKNIERRYAKTQFYQRFLSWNLSLPKRKEEAA